MRVWILIYCHFTPLLTIDCVVYSGLRVSDKLNVRNMLEPIPNPFCNKSALDEAGKVKTCSLSSGFMAYV